jgi:hypothetical protein
MLKDKLKALGITEKVIKAENIESTGFKANRISAGSIKYKTHAAEPPIPVDKEIFEFEGYITVTSQTVDYDAAYPKVEIEIEVTRSIHGIIPYPTHNKYRVIIIEL